jgi:hypothetical protein
MDRGVGSFLLTEKLDRTNYASWSYKMHQYLLGLGFWSYVDDANDTVPDPTDAGFVAWEKSASRVMYYFASYVGEQLLCYIRDAGMPKAAWENLKKIFVASTTARKLQLRQELSNLRQQDLSVADYTLKINEICNSLALIDVNIDESEKVQIYLGGLASKFGAFRTAVCTREATPSFFDLQSMLLVEENHVGVVATGAHTDNKMLYAEGERPRGRGGRNELVSRGGNRQRRHQKDACSNPGPSAGRGSHGETAPDCWYCGKKGHRESECYDTAMTIRTHDTMIRKQET